MSVWSIGSLDEEEQKKKLMSAMPEGFGGPKAVAVQEGATTQIMKQAGGAMASKAGSVAGAALGNVLLPGIGGFIGSALGGAAGGALAGGGGGVATAQTPAFDGGDLVNKQADTSVTIPTQMVAGPLNPSQEATQRAFEEEEYMRKFGGNNYAV